MNACPFPYERPAAVSLTYDDASPTHLSIVKDALASHDFNATFYTHLTSPLLDNAEAWREMAAAGHEIGNHTIFHPCIKHAGKAWLADCFNLKTYDSTRFQAEVKVANQVLKLIDGKTERTYGNTCHNNWIGTGESSVCLETLLPEHFIAARGESKGKLVDPAKPNFYNLGTIGIDGKSFEEIKALIDQTIAEKKWAIFTMHHVAEEGLAIAPDTHDTMIDYLASHREVLYAGPVIQIAKSLKKSISD